MVDREDTGLLEIARRFRLAVLEEIFDARVGGGVDAVSLRALSIGASPEVKAQAERASGRRFADWTPVSVRSQVVAGTNYDICWQIFRNKNPKTMTVTWRLPTISPTTRG